MLSLRQLPAIDTLLRAPELAGVVHKLGTSSTKSRLRALQEQWRSEGGAPLWADQAAGYAAHLDAAAQSAQYTPVFNMTGTLVHTNLGRAPLAESVLSAIADAARGNVALEFDLSTGRRGSRDKPVTERLAALTGAEAATVVNNNAAAVMIALNTFALTKEVPVSRGELIEIGGSFRLPELMQRANCTLKEVGTTNRTRITDFANAVSPNTGMLMKVHPSNFYIEGFTEATSNKELSELAVQHDIPFCVDLGSGTLIDLQSFGLPHEPMPQEALKQGADLVTFSGDKLLGGAQAGLIVGRKKYIDMINQNPMKRALLCDKLTLVALAETLKLYENPDQLTTTLPLLGNMTRPLAELKTTATQIVNTLAPLLPELQVSVVESTCQIGSGALPDKRIESIAVRLQSESDQLLRETHERLRSLRPAVVGRIQGGELLLDTRSISSLSKLLTTLAKLNDTAHTP